MRVVGRFRLNTNHYILKNIIHLEPELEIGNAEEENCEAESLELEETGISIHLSPPPSIPVPPPANSRAIPMVPSSIQTPWSTSVSSIPLEEFSSEVGPTVEIPDSPLGIFELFYTLQIIVRESNRYAKEVTISSAPLCSHC